MMVFTFMKKRIKLVMAILFKTRLKVEKNSYRKTHYHAFFFSSQTYFLQYSIQAMIDS